MTTRRSRGDGGLHWDEGRQRWIATVTIGYDGRGKRITRKASGKTKTEAKDKLREIQRDYEDGLTAKAAAYSVADAVNYWLAYGLGGRDPHTVDMYRTYTNTHIIPALGRRKLRELTVEDVEQLLAKKSAVLSTRSLRILHSILSRSVRHAQVRDKIRRNVILLCDVPEGRAGRPSKALTLEQAVAVLDAADKAAGPVLKAYIVLSLLTGARTEELRALRWDHVVAYDEDAGKWLPVATAGWAHERFAIHVWRSVRAKGDTKTRKSRRTLAVAMRCVYALLGLWDVRPCGHDRRTGCACIVFISQAGTELDAHNVRRGFRRVLAAAGLAARQWTSRELRTSFVSLLSDDGVPIEQIARLVGHASTVVTETVYRKQLRPVIEEGATAMDRIFPAAGD
jgi:integrase